MPDEACDGAKSGMLADLGIERHLQRHEVELAVQSVREQPEHGTLCEAMERLAPCRAQPGKQLRQRQAAVMSIVREPCPPNGSGKVIEDRPQCRVAERTAHVALRCRGSAGQVAIKLRPARKPRIAVDTKLLEGNEVGPEVALLESADPDTMLLRDRAGHPVNRPAVAEQQHDVAPQLFQQTREELRPLGGCATAVE